MHLIEVTDKNSSRDFLMTNVQLNKNNPHYIRPLDKDINEVFDPKKNKAFRHGEICRWILKDEQGNLTGRIAAFVNKKYRNKGDDFPVGGIGFFDCTNDQQAADMLFDVAKHWLIQHGMEESYAGALNHNVVLGVPPDIGNALRRIQAVKLYLSTVSDNF